MSDAATVNTEPLGGVDVASGAMPRATRMSLLDRWLPRGTATQVIAVRETPLRVFVRSVTFVVLYWWLATGAIFALERSQATRGAGLALAIVLGAIGVLLLVRARDDASPVGARRSFLGGAFLWSLVQVSFYGGWLVGPTGLAQHVPVQQPSLAFATQAVISMLWYQLAMLAALWLAFAITWDRINRTGWWALSVFYTTHQLACISIFLGVANPGRGFFPQHLVFLESYFGPAQNSLFLILSVVVLLALTLTLAIKALRSSMPMRRQGLTLLTVLGTLGVLELLVLGLAVELNLWDMFLEFRGY
jgi:putative photosynthetic complex assembly protein 2